MQTSKQTDEEKKLAEELKKAAKKIKPKPALQKIKKRTGKK